MPRLEHSNTPHHATYFLLLYVPRSDFAPLIAAGAVIESEATARPLMSLTHFGLIASIAQLHSHDGKLTERISGTMCWVKGYARHALMR